MSGCRSRWHWPRSSTRARKKWWSSTSSHGNRRRPVALNHALRGQKTPLPGMPDCELRSCAAGGFLRPWWQSGPRRHLGRLPRAPDSLGEGRGGGDASGDATASCSCVGEGAAVAGTGQEEEEEEETSSWFLSLTLLSCSGTAMWAVLALALFALSWCSSWGRLLTRPLLCNDGCFWTRQCRTPLVVAVAVHRQGRRHP